MTESRVRDLLLKGVFVTGMLVTGTINTISKKAQNDSVAQGAKGYPPHSFEHPWYIKFSKVCYDLRFQTVVMFLGEFVCLWVFALQMACKRKEPQDNFSSGNVPPKSNRLVKLHHYLNITAKYIYIYNSNILRYSRYFLWRNWIIMGICFCLAGFFILL